MALPIGELERLNGQLKISAAEAIEHEDLIKAKRFTEIPSNGQLRCDYLARTDGLPTYVGFAPRGLSTSTSEWLLQKFTYDGNAQMTLRQIAYDSWDNRSIASYS